MKERPILFSAPMVLAILDGTKTQTRRIIKPQPTPEQNYTGFVVESTCAKDEGKHRWCGKDMGDRPLYIRCPYGLAGEQLWVRETFADPNDQVTVYRANWKEDARARGLDNIPTDDRGFQWSPSIHMHRYKSRIDLLITGVRVERLQDIKAADAKAEGAKFFSDIPTNSPYRNEPRWSMENPTHTDQCLGTPEFAFANFFNKINGPALWDSNPWVWVIEFDRIKP